MKAGAACLDITPPLGTLMPGLFHDRRAAAVHDPLQVRAFALEQDGTGIAIAVCDLIGVKREFLDQAKARIAETVGLTPAQVLICCTHTHTGALVADEPYAGFVIGRVADAVRLAWERREPAEVGWGRAEEERVVFNRRFRMKDSSIQTNPGVGNPEVVKAAGPVDPYVSVLCLRRPDGTTIGVLANYALHYVGTPESQDTISADYFGYFGEILQRMRGERFVAALSNGACADINNIDVLSGTRHRNDRYQHTERVAALVAAAAFWAWNEVAFTDDVPLGAAMEEVRLQRRPLPSPEETARGQEIDARVAARERVTMGERAFARRVLRRIHDVAAEVPTWVQALRIGDLVLVSAPGELFVELGLQIKAQSPFGQVMVLELANDTVGYLPTRRAFEEGAYEPEASAFGPGVGEQIVASAIGLMEGLRRG
jgi:hypothetical protein